MLSATLYVIVCSARNRARMRLRRMREPRYLLGAIAGVAYLVFAILMRERAFVSRGGPVSAAPVAATAAGFVGPDLGGVLLALLSLASWVLPFGSGLLDFSKAETSFLYPAPVTRSQLVFYRLMRSQYAVFIGALIMVLAYPSASLPARLRGLVGLWVLLMTSHVFFTATTLARSRLRQPGGWVVALPVLGLSAGAVLSVIVPLWRGASTATLQAIPADLRPERGRVRLGDRRRDRSLPARRGLADLGGCQAARCGRRHRRAAGEPSLDLSAALCREDGRMEARPDRARRDGVRLEGDAADDPHGRSPRAAARAPHPRLDGWRLDVRHPRTRTGVADGGLRHLGCAVLAVHGAAIIRGEMAWPALVVTAITWLFGALAMLLSLISTSRIPTPNRFAVWLSFLILIPAIVLAQYLMHNAVAVVFPGWVPIGASRPRGVDAVGQRLILLAANWIGLLLALTPGLLLSAGLSALLRPVVGPVILPVGAVLTSMIVVGEVWLATELLGPIYERMDITATERPD